MKIIYKINEALQIGEKYIEMKKKEKNIDGFDYLSSVPFDPEPQPSNSPWEMSMDALENTLNYLFNYLHYSCYLMGSDGSHSTLYKLESTTTPPFLNEVIKKELSQLNNNRKLSEAQKNNIREFIGNGKNRLLQCIVKKIKQDTTTSYEYEKFVKQIRLPKGIYVMNLTDANLLHKDYINPFPIFRKQSVPLPVEYYGKFIPIFSLSGHVKYFDIPIPNYDDVSYVIGMAKYKIESFMTDWWKKEEKAVFRGGPSGCGYTTETNARLRLASMTSPDLDVGIVADPAKMTVDSNSIRFDPVYGLGMLNTGLKPVQKLSYLEQSHYKYIIHVDGNVNAYRLLSTMATRSLILRVKSNYTSWFDHLIGPDEHYVEINADLSNLLEKIEWCKMNDRLCSQMAERAFLFARKALTYSYVKNAFQKLVYYSHFKESGTPYYLKPDEPQINPKSPIYDPRANNPESPFYNPRIGNTESPPYAPKGNTPSPSKGNTPSPPYAPKGNTPPQSPPKFVNQKDSTVDDFYVKGENEKKCKKGYVQDKKDKTKCISSNKTRKISSVMNEKIPSLNVKPPSPVIQEKEKEEEKTEKEKEDFYVKGENEKKCKNGYVQDKKDKTKCISSNKTVKITQPKKIESKKIESNKELPLHHSEYKDIRKKCESIKMKIKNAIDQ